MDNVKNRMYNYEVTPPKGLWEAISAELDSNGAKVISISKKKKNTIYYIAAASVAVIVFCFIFFTTQTFKNANEPLVTSSDNVQRDTGTNNNLLMTVPVEEKTMLKNNGGNNERVLAQNKREKIGPDEEQNKSAGRKNDTIDTNFIASNSSGYITIEGPQGQPVKISSKMATLIDSSETKVSAKPVWHKKINEWREIMKANTLAPTPGNFLDIVELTKSLRDNK